MVGKSLFKAPFTLSISPGGTNLAGLSTPGQGLTKAGAHISQRQGLTKAGFTKAVRPRRQCWVLLAQAQPSSVAHTGDQA